MQNNAPPQDEQDFESLLRELDTAKALIMYVSKKGQKNSELVATKKKVMKLTTALVQMLIYALWSLGVDMAETV